MGIKKLNAKRCARPMFHKLIYTDQKVTRRKEGVLYSKLLHDKAHNLTGKPDYIYAHIFTKRPFVVEIKSGEIGNDPHPRYGDLMQLTAYFFIANATFGRRPKKGWLMYRDCVFIIKNTKKLRKELLNVLVGMEQMLETSEGCAAPSFVQCRHCICRNTVCEHQP